MCASISIARATGPLPQALALGELRLEPETHIRGQRLHGLRLQRRGVHRPWFFGQRGHSLKLGRSRSTGIAGSSTRRTPSAPDSSAPGAGWGSSPPQQRLQRTATTSGKWIRLAWLLVSPVTTSPAVHGIGLGGASTGRWTLWFAQDVSA